ncbi:MAG: hypothetical protein QXZ17_15225 [Nitrososphaerota archaeon]
MNKRRKLICFIQKLIPDPSISEMIDLKGDVTRQSMKLPKNWYKMGGCRK